MDEERKENNDEFEQELVEEEDTDKGKNKEDSNDTSEELDEDLETDSKNNTQKINPQDIIDEAKDNDKISQRLIQDEMKESYIDYAMSVIIGRALPEVRDGLKPVHRRILFAMHELKMYHNKPFKKCARIVGEVLGKYHPHGDTAVYDAMVRMAQEFSLRYPMVQGQGNFGSIDGDNAAAMRYTEARLSKLAEEMLKDIEKETVALNDNFDGSLKEPAVLPCKFPSLLLNGSNGIAVGMATSIPPHNLTEVCSGLIALIDNDEMSINDIMEYIKGPDYPTGAIGYGRQGIINAYHTGQGRSIMRSRVEIDDNEKKKRLIVKEIPYQVNKTNLINEIVNLVKNKIVTSISDIRDESDSRTGIRLVIELKRDSNPEVVLNQLYKHSRLQTSFGITLLSIQDKRPKVMNLKEMMEAFLDHRKDVIIKRTEYDLRKAKEKEHILEGLVIALDNIDEAIRLIKKAKSTAEAKASLVDSFELTEIQASAILDMKLQKLTGLEQDKIREELKALLEIISDLESILASIKKVKEIIKEELQDMIDRFGDKRRTELLDVEDETGYIDYESIVEPEEVVITITHKGYIKRIPLATYSAQNRGGKGIIATTTKDEDFVEQMFIANTKDFILFFTEDGKVHWIKVYRIPEQNRYSGGKAIVNLLDLNDVKISTFIKVKEFSDEYCDNNYFVFATENGTVKKVSARDLSRPRAGGIKAINLNEKDSLVNVVLTDGEQKLILATRNGKAVRFEEKNVRAMGRTATGVRGIRLKDDDKVVGLIRGNDEKTILTMTENGFGKRTKISDYRIINRGGSGVINILCSKRNGKVVSVMSTDDETEMMFITKNGTIIRTRAKDINVIGRNTQGVRIMKMKDDDIVVAAARITGLDDKTDEEELKEDKDSGDKSKEIIDEVPKEVKVVEDLEKMDETEEELTIIDEEALRSEIKSPIKERISEDELEEKEQELKKETSNEKTIFKEELKKEGLLPRDIREIIEESKEEKDEEEEFDEPLEKSPEEAKEEAKEIIEEKIEKEKTIEEASKKSESDVDPKEIEDITKDILRKNL